MDAGKSKATDCVNQSKEADKALEVITHAVYKAFDAVHKSRQRLKNKA